MVGCIRPIFGYRLVVVGWGPTNNLTKDPHTRPLSPHGGSNVEWRAQEGDTRPFFPLGGYLERRVQVGDRKDFNMLCYQLRATSWHLIGDDVFGPLSLAQVPVDEAGDALFHADLGLPAEELAGFGDVGNVGEDVGFVGWDVADAGFFPQAFFEHVDGLVDGKDLVTAEVDDLVTEGLETEDGAAGDVIDVGEAAGLVAIAGDEDIAVLSDPLAEAEEGHIGATGRSVDGEVAENGDVEVVEEVVSMG